MAGFCGDWLDTGRELLARETGATQFRWIDIGVSTLAPAQDADPADLVDQRGRCSALPS